MSRTKKDSRFTNPKKDSISRKKKSKAYLAEKDAGEAKFVPDHGLALCVTKLGKLVAKNANRSRKKAARQEAKQQINDTLNGEVY